MTAMSSMPVTMEVVPGRLFVLHWQLLGNWQTLEHEALFTSKHWEVAYFGGTGRTYSTECRLHVADVPWRNYPTFSPDFDPLFMFGGNWWLFSCDWVEGNTLFLPERMTHLHYVGKDLGSEPRGCSGICCPCVENETNFLSANDGSSCFHVVVSPWRFVQNLGMPPRRLFISAIVIVFSSYLA